MFSMDVLEHVRPERHGRDSARTEAHPATGRSGVPRHRPGRSPHERRFVDHILELPGHDAWLWTYSARTSSPTTTAFAHQTSCASFRDMAPMWSGASPALIEGGEGPTSPEGKLKVSDRLPVIRSMTWRRPRPRVAHEVSAAQGSLASNREAQSGIASGSVMTATSEHDEVRVLYMTGARQIGGMKTHLLILASNLHRSFDASCAARMLLPTIWPD